MFKMEKGFEEMFESLGKFSEDFMGNWDEQKLEEKKRSLKESQELEELFKECFGD